MLCLVSGGSKCCAKRLNSSELEASIKASSSLVFYLLSLLICNFFVGYLALSLSPFLWVFVFAQPSNTLISLVAITTKVLISVK